MPDTHWAARLPLILPMGGAIALFGDTLGAVALVPLLYTTGTVLMLSVLVATRFGRLAGTVAGLALVATPVVNLMVLQPGVDLAELFWLLVAAAAGLRALENPPRAGWAALAGAAAALALLSRASAVAALPILGVGLLVATRTRPSAPLLAAAILGFAAPLLVEALAHALTAGDPLHGWTLSLHHTRIPSSELAAAVDTAGSPLLNLDIIRGWRRAMGIEVHWTLDPLLNLLAHPAVNLTLLLAAALGATASASVRWPILWLAMAAFAHFLIITYALAIDPKPRMFLPGVALAATIIGITAAARPRALIVVVALVLLLIRAVTAAVDRIDTQSAQPLVERWIADARGRAAVAPDLASLLAFSDPVRRLDANPPAAADTLLLLSAGSCPDAGPRWRLAEAHGLAAPDPPLLARACAAAILLQPRLVPNACRYRRGPPG